MNEQLDSFSIKELLTDSSRYLVPMYQRNYAWGEGEIRQLIQDVLDFAQQQSGSSEERRYYIGNLVVFKRPDDSFEVIDGQQRFTTLTLLTLCLKRLANAGQLSFAMDWFHQPNLTFESRELSTSTLMRLMQCVSIGALSNEVHNPDLLNGYTLLEKSLLALGGELNDFCHHLFEHVQITRVPVPADTDLNHYFEVMNSRGEQLEKHEVLKARLMSVLHNIKNVAERRASLHALTKVWDAAANMERYIQYGFTPDERHRLFGQNDWGMFIPKNFTDLCKCLTADAGDNAEASQIGKTLQQILDSSPDQAQTQTYSEPQPERFNSVINFPNFLLHALKVWSGQDVSLDDKQLLQQFEEHIGESICRVKDFVFALLKTKYLFDQFIIKREFSAVGDSWSLKRLRYYGAKSQSYVNTFDKDSEDGFDGINRRILMLLSALHVSNPTAVYKHWLNGALAILYALESIRSDVYLQKLEQMARSFVFGRYLHTEYGHEYYAIIYQGQDYPVFNSTDPRVLERLKYGRIENNLVFNYLDYLIWCDASEHRNKSDDVIFSFEFTFRSSVEHFSPQNPMEGFTPLPFESLHSFGNLCLISHSKNSRLSNLQPKSKRDYFQVAIKDKKIDSLKLYKMIGLMDKDNCWGEMQVIQHQNEMLELLHKAQLRAV